MLLSPEGDARGQALNLLAHEAMALILVRALLFEMFRNLAIQSFVLVSHRKWLVVDNQKVNNEVDRDVS